MSVDNIRYHWLACKEGYFAHGRKGFNSIILHHSGGSKAGDIMTLTGQTDRKVSAHWYITRSGDVWHFVQDSDTAYHAGVVDRAAHDNAHSIGIEQEGSGAPWPDAQVKSCAQLCAALLQKHGTMEITTHKAVARPVGRKDDPKDYPMDKFNFWLTEAQQTHWGFQAI